MSKELTDPEKSKALDGFDFEERFAGNDEEHAGGVIQGSLVKFTNEVTWVANGEELPADLELIGIDVHASCSGGKTRRQSRRSSSSPGNKFRTSKR